MSTKTQLLAQIATIDAAAAETLAKAKKADLVAWLAQHSDEDETPKTMANTLVRYRAGYEHTTSYSGRKSLDNGDEIAAYLRGLTPQQVCELADKHTPLSEGTHAAKYTLLNAGQQRMNAGNKLRAAAKRGELTIADLSKG